VDGRTLLDMDLILPQGYGEVLSGGEREHEYEQILKRMEYKGTSLEDFKWYLQIAEDERLVPSAGCGFGIFAVYHMLALPDYSRKSREWTGFEARCKI